MNTIHYIFYSMKLLILLSIVLMRFNIIPQEGPLFLILDTLFKFSLGVYVIYFFGFNLCPNINPHDRLLFIISGFILIILIDFKSLLSVITGKQTYDTTTSEEQIHVVSKPCPPCDMKNIIHGKIVHD